MTPLRGFLIAVLVFITLVGPAVLGDLFSEEIRNRLDRLPHGIIRLAVRRLPLGIRQELTEEWSSELHEILRGAEALPITRVFRGTGYALGLLRTASRIGRALSEEADRARARELTELNELLETRYKERVQMAEARARVAEEQARMMIAQATEQVARRRHELESSIEALRAFERDYRARLRDFVSGQITALDNVSPDPQAHPAVVQKTNAEKDGVEALRAFERDYRARLRAFLEGQLKALDEASRPNLRTQNPTSGW